MSFRDATALFRTEVRDLDRQFEVRSANSIPVQSEPLRRVLLRRDLRGLLNIVGAPIRGHAPALGRNIVSFYGDGPRPVLDSRKARKQVGPACAESFVRCPTEEQRQASNE